MNNFKICHDVLLNAKNRITDNYNNTMQCINSDPFDIDLKLLVLPFVYFYALLLYIILY